MQGKREEARAWSKSSVAMEGTTETVRPFWQAKLVCGRVAETGDSGETLQKPQRKRVSSC